MLEHWGDSSEGKSACGVGVGTEFKSPAPMCKNLGLDLRIGGWGNGEDSRRGRTRRLLDLASSETLFSVNKAETNNGTPNTLLWLPQTLSQEHICGHVSCSHTHVNKHVHVE